MATEDILIRYRADVSQLEADLNKLIDSQEQLTTATKQNTAEQTKAASSAEFAAKKRAQLLDQETKKLQQLKEAQKLAFDPAQIEKYNNQIAASQKRIELLGGSYQQAAQKAQDSNQQLLGGLNRIAGAFGVAFSAEALIQFGQQAVNSFLAAEETANQLRFAVLSIAGESEEALVRLEEQAQRVADTTFFGDDDIKAAQAAGLAFGLTAEQVERAIPALVEFAASPGSKVNSVTEAMQSLGGALQGRAGDFKNFGVEVKATNTQAENLDAVVGALANKTGAAADALKTASGQAKDAKDQFGELSESIGQGLVEVIVSFVNVIKEAFGPLIDNIRELGKAFLNLIPDAVLTKIKEFIGEGNALNVLIKVSLAPILALAKAWELLTSAFIKLVPIYGGVIAVVKAGFQEVKDLASALGSSIADIFTGITEFDPAKIKSGLGKLKSGFQNIGFDVAKSFNEGYEKGQALFKDANKGIIDEQKKVTDVLLASDELRKKKTKELIDLQAKYSKDQTNAGKQNLEAINKELEARKKQGDAAKKSGEDAKKAAEEFAKLLQSLDAELAKVQADLAKRKIEVIPADSQKAQVERIQALADLNEQAINEEIAAKIKAVQEDAKLSEKQKQEVIAKYNELKQARLDLAQFNEQNELNIISKQQADRIEAAYAQIDALDLEKALTIQADKVETANEAVAKSFEDLSTAVSKADFEAAKEGAKLRTKQLNEEIQNEQNLRETQIKANRDAELAKVKDGDAAAIERKAINDKYNNEIEKSQSDTNKKIAKNNEELTNQLANTTDSYAARWINANQEVLQQTQQIVGQINELFAQASEQRISQIEEQREAQLGALDQQLADNELLFEQRRITEEQLLAEQERIAAEKVKIEEEAQKKIRAEKKKQAIIDKAAALFDIAVNTAVAVSKVLAQTGVVSPALIPLIIAAGALQAAAVIAQPIPYRKGSKDTGAKGHMARVGEEGEEFVWMPANSKVLPAKQTRKYGDIIDAMYDNKLDNYIYKNYITPALLAQKQAKENQQSKSFAQNMADSIVYNQSGLTASDLEAQRKRGQYIRNVDEIAVAIAKKLPTFDPYRR